jgi:ABC-2 type transport system permease protein
MWVFFRRVRAMARKEVAHVRRDPGMLWLAIGMPLLLILIFGFGVRFDADHLPVVLVDLDRSPASEELARDLFASGVLQPVASPRDVPEALHLLGSNTAVAALVIPPGTGRRVALREPVTLQLLVDGTDGTVANMLLADAEATVSAVAARRATTQPAYRPQAITRYNPRGESAMFLLPGTIAYVLALVCVLLTGLAVAREWERGSMEQLFATTIGIPEIVLGKLLPYVGLGVVDVLLSLALGALVFDLPMRGSLVWVALGSFLFIFGMLGQGLLISIVTRSQMLATQLGALSAMLPSMLLSGFLFPVDNLPLPIWLLSNVVPARFLIALLRSVLLRGGGLREIWGDLLGLFVFGAVMFTLSSLLFRRRIA